jgi:RNA recognition motif-containing protein
MRRRSASPVRQRRRHGHDNRRSNGAGHRGSYGQRSIRSPPSNRRRSPPVAKGRREDQASTEERDARTVFVWQLSQKVREDDVQDLMSRAGRVRDVRLIIDRRSGRHKGQGYVEYYHASSVPASLALNGELVCGHPIAVRSMVVADSAATPGTGALVSTPSAIPVEIPQPPPPDMPGTPRTFDNKASSNPPPSLPAQSSSAAVKFEHPPPHPPTAQNIVPARLVSAKELVLLLNPFSLPVESPGMNGAITAATTAATPVAGVVLPESQQVPLPIPGMSAVAPMLLSQTHNAAGVPFASSSAAFTRLYVGSVPFTVSEDDLMTIFKPFGDIISLQLQRESGTGRSRGYGFIEFANHECAKKALDLNGLILAGRSLKVNLASSSGPSTMANQAVIAAQQQQSALTSSVVPLPGPAGAAATAMSDMLSGEMSGELDEGRDGGLAMNASQRAMLMQRLSRGQDMGGAVPSAVQTSSGSDGGPAVLGSVLSTNFNQPCNTTTEQTPCLLIGNMFDPVAEARVNPSFELELAEDVRDEVSSKYGTIKHLFVDKASQGLVYLAFEDASSASNAKNGLNGRWFGGNCISADFVSEAEYKRRLPHATI